MTGLMEPMAGLSSQLGPSAPGSALPLGAAVGLVRGPCISLVCPRPPCSLHTFSERSSCPEAAPPISRHAPPGPSLRPWLSGSGIIQPVTSAALLTWGLPFWTWLPLHFSREPGRSPLSPPCAASHPHFTSCERTQPACLSSPVDFTADRCSLRTLLGTAVAPVPAHCGLQVAAAYYSFIHPFIYSFI